MAKVDNLEDLFLQEISDVYNAEKQLTKALPKMAKHSTNAKLKQGFETHLAETEDQIVKLDQVFEIIGQKPKRITCEAMKGLIEEGSEAFDDFEEGPIMDVALIIAAQKVEHYEISAYGSLCAVAEQLGYSDAVAILRQIEAQEKATDEKLTKLALSTVNSEAALAQAA